MGGVDSWIWKRLWNQVTSLIMIIALDEKWGIYTNIYEYIYDNLKEKKIADKLLKSIDNKIKVLEIFPFAHELYKKEENFEYQKLIVKNYIIIYKINLKEKEIFISHIYNQKFNYNKKSILL